MKNEFIEIRFHTIFLVLTKDEYLKALKRGRTVQRNRKLAREREKKEVTYGVDRSM